MADASSALSSAQTGTLNTLRHMASLARCRDGQYLVRVGEPRRLHPGEGSAVLVEVEAWDPRVPEGTHPLPSSTRTFLIEAAGCAVEVHGV